MISHEISEDAGTVITAASDKADVKMGDAFLRDIGGANKIGFSDGHIAFEAVMETTIPMWRPETTAWNMISHITTSVTSSRLAFLMIYRCGKKSYQGPWGEPNICPRF